MNKMENILMRHVFDFDSEDLDETIELGLAGSKHRDVGKLSEIVQTIREMSPEEVSMVTSDTRRAYSTAEIIAKEVGYSGEIDTRDDLERKIPPELFQPNGNEEGLRLIVSHQPPIQQFLSSVGYGDVMVRNAEAYLVEVPEFDFGYNIRKITSD